MKCTHYINLVMDKEQKYLKNLLQELPREEAPVGITQLIMQKIEKQEISVPLQVTKIWQTQAFYVMLALVLTEVWLLWSYRAWFTVENITTVAKIIYVDVLRYFALHNFNMLIGAFVLAGISLYLFVKYRLEDSDSFAKTVSFKF